MKRDIDSEGTGQRSPERLPAQSARETRRVCDRGALCGQVPGVSPRHGWGIQLLAVFAGESVVRVYRIRRVPPERAPALASLTVVRWVFARFQ